MQPKLKIINFIIKLFVFILFLSSITIHIAAMGSELVPISFNGDPQYSIITQTNDIYVRPLSPLKVELYISGAGDVNYSRLSVSVPRNIVYGEKMILKRMSYIPLNPITGEILKELKVEEVDPRFYLQIESTFYKLVRESDNNYSAKPQILGESSYIFPNNKTQYSPITIEFAIDKNAFPGDYNLFIHYFYKYLDKWYQDTEIITLHINHWYEEEIWQWLLMGLALLSIISVLASIFGEIKKLINFIKIKFN
jgi:hypothetical protein